MARIIYVTATEPNPIGHGGNHRAYQIEFELIQRFGPEAVTVMTYQYRWSSAINAPTTHETAQLSMLRRLQRLIDRTRENPFKFFGDTYFSINRYSDPAFLYRYEQLIRTSRPDLCIIDSASFSKIVHLNRQFGIPTVACCHELMALDSMDPSNSHWLLPVTVHNFANELKLLSLCDERICISPVEAALIGGLGYSTFLYPYQPVGQIAHRFNQIREARQATDTSSGPYLMIGSAHHPTTREGMQWLLEQVIRYPLTDGAQLVVTGGDTERLLSYSPPPTITLTGWLEQNSLDQLLTTARAVLIPHWRGFGALTKLAELAYAEIPMLVSQHPLYSFPPLPGVISVDRRWESWQVGLAQLESLRPFERIVSTTQTSVLGDIAERFVNR